MLKILGDSGVFLLSRPLASLNSFSMDHPEAILIQLIVGNTTDCIL